MNPAKLARKWFSVVLLTSVVLLPGFSQTGSPPEILEIVFPHETIPADGSIHSGKVVFKDADGDAKWADFHVEAPDLQALTISDQTPEDGVVRLEVRAPADRQKQGQGIVLFKIAATAPQQVTIRVVLTDEAGNASDPNDPKATFSFAVRGPEPDLVVSLGELPESIQVGQTLETSYTIQNLGGSDSGPFRVGVYLSREAAITPEDLLIDSKEIGNLAPDASTTERLKVDLTQDLLARGGLEPGSLFLGVIADDLNRVEESDETNNIASSAIQVELPPKRPAFFKVVDLSIEPKSPVAGSTVTIKATIENTGEEPGTKPVELYIDGVRRDSLSLTLNPGQRKTVSFSYTFAFTEPPLRVEITVKTPDDEQTLTVTVSQPPHTVCPSGCPFTKIQEAIDAAKSGDIVTIGPGTYEENLKITKSLTLKGANKDQVILRGGTTGEPVIVVRGARVGIEDLTITEGKAWEIEEGAGILIEERAKVTITNIILSNIDTRGLLVQESAEVTLRNSRISDNKAFGIHIRRKSKAYIYDNTIERNGDIGILVIGSSEAEIKRNKVINTKADPEVIGLGDGIEVGDDSKATIESNTISGSARYGIFLFVRLAENPSARLRPSSAVIKNNTVQNSGAGGIWIDSSQVALEKNVIEGNVGVGTMIYGTAKVEVINNVIQNNKSNAQGEVGDGVEVLGDAQATLKGNTITGNARVGIGLWENAKATIQNNIIKNNGGCGIYAEHSYNITSCSGNTVSGNKEGNYCGAARGRCY